MIKKTQYPLEEVALVKKKRLEEAEKALKEKKHQLQNEKTKLELAKRKRDDVKKHRDIKIKKYLDEMMGGISAPKINMHEKYIQEVVDKELKEEEKKVKEQAEAVKKAEAALEKAREDWFKKHQEVEKMALHRKEWDREVQIEMDRLEATQNDELGSSTHVRKKRKDQ